MNSWLGGLSNLLHHRIVELRKSKKITQEELAKKIDVSRSALSQYELGLRQPDYDIIKRIADFFGVSTDYLLGRETKKTSIEETKMDEERKRLADIIVNIKDPEKKKQAIAFLEYLANSPTDGAKK
jgi:transcriptional regulator with XRE-family HTH domain